MKGAKAGAKLSAWDAMVSSLAPGECVLGRMEVLELYVDERRRG